MKRTIIIWFRRDLRLTHNPALEWAVNNSDSILPVYIYSDKEESPWTPGAASRWWLHHSLQALKASLQNYQLDLYCFRGDSHDILSKLQHETSADTLVLNKLYEPHLIQRDKTLTESLSHTIEIKFFDTGLLFTPGSILNNQSMPYRVYTPFYKKCHALLTANHAIQTISPVPATLSSRELTPVKCTTHVDDLNLLDKHCWHEKFSHYWRPGETNALHQLTTFIESRSFDYKHKRDIPASDGTSRLSASLHFGEITPHQILAELQTLIYQQSDNNDTNSLHTFLKQIIWREFSHHILWHFPQTDLQPMNSKFHPSFWSDQPSELFDCWTQGRTGIPIVDAGMKQLWETGWMHNRVRMIVSSLLTKNMGVSWQQGAQWFWNTLVDADLANNSMGWQWVAGCGVDASPYYRIFNPLTQADRFDQKHQYINNWYNQNETPPAAIIDLKTSRVAALQRYQNIKSE